LGFPLIEVGHGIGLGASEKVVAAVASDVQYARAAAEVISQSQWGMFAIAGIAEPDDIAEMADVGMGFVRIGVEPGKSREAEVLVSASLSAGVSVFINMMKSYVLTPQTLSSQVEVYQDCGVDGVYLVDSAGGLLPTEISAYADAMLEVRQSIDLGFHGHDNLGLAVSHSLLVTEMGFDIVDCTLQGMGRSAGNAPTERLVAAYTRLGILSPDVRAVCIAGEQLARPKLPQAGFSGLDTFSGFALFHSSYLPALLEAARKFHVDPYSLMQEHCAVDRLNANQTTLEVIAQRIQAGETATVSSWPSGTYFGGDQ
jgi:4-hydroxy-2-oxovalerate aldolase